MFFFFNDTATTEIYTLSLHDALPILIDRTTGEVISATPFVRINATKGVDLKTGRLIENPEKAPAVGKVVRDVAPSVRSEEHTSELQSRLHLVCRLLLEKKNKLRDEHI